MHTRTYVHTRTPTLLWSLLKCRFLPYSQDFRIHLFGVGLATCIFNQSMPLPPILPPPQAILRKWSMDHPVRKHCSVELRTYYLLFLPGASVSSECRPSGLSGFYSFLSIDLNSHLTWFPGPQPRPCELESLGGGAQLIWKFPSGF